MTKNARKIIKNHDKEKGSQDAPRQLPNLGNEFALPQYQGGSIINLPDSVCKWFGIPTLGMGPFKEKVTTHIKVPVKRVVVVIVDAVSYRHFQKWTQKGSSPTWKDTLAAGDLTAITSISPSTTCAAMTSLWTGQPACRHGVSGYEMWMKEYNMAVNMIVHGPTSFRHGRGTLGQTGFDPTTFLPLPTLGMHLKAHDIQAHAFQHYSNIHSGLSQTFLQDVELHGINTPVEMWISVRQLLESRPKRRMYITAYWGAVDGYFHRFGPGDERAKAEFTSFIQHLQEQFLDELNTQAKKDTLFILTADHGQIPTPYNPHYHLENHPQLSDMLHLKPTGENRLAYLHIRPGKEEAVREYMEEQWPGDFRCYPSYQLTKSGLFGPGPYHPHWHSRVGDLTVIAKNDAYLWWSNDENDLLGRHGGLSQDEMIVPLFVLLL